MPRPKPSTSRTKSSSSSPRRGTHWHVTSLRRLRPRTRWLLSRGKVPDPVPVQEAILSFFVGLHAMGFVYIDLRPSNVIRVDWDYLVIDLEFVRPVKEAVPGNLTCRSVLEEAGFPETNMTASTCMDLVMLRKLMVTCKWTNQQDPHYGALLAYLAEVGPATGHTASAALDILNKM